MPNHVANRITGPGLPIIRGLLKGEDRAVDFNRLVPRPEGLGVGCHMGVIDAAKVACKDWPQSGEGFSGLAEVQSSNMQRQESPLSFNDKDWEHFLQCLQNKRQHGEYTWYDWCCKHWGTKWNAYDAEDNDESLYFETAWSCPAPIVRVLADSLPDGIDFLWEYADEDYGHNLARLVPETDPDRFPCLNSRDLEEWAMRLHGRTDEDIAEYRAEVEGNS